MRTDLVHLARTTARSINFFILVRILYWRIFCFFSNSAIIFSDMFIGDISVFFHKKMLERLSGRQANYDQYGGDHYGVGQPVAFVYEGEAQPQPELAPPQEQDAFGYYMPSEVESAEATTAAMGNSKDEEQPLNVRDS